MIQPAVLAAAVAFGLAATLTPLIGWFARRIGAVAAPKSDRWHRKPTAMLGGVAIYLAVVLTALIAVPHRPHLFLVLGASTILFAVGLVDDFLHIRPYQKLIGQIVAAALVIAGGLVLPWTSSAPLDMAITLVWLIGITNSVNMLDNMDGLSAGVVAIAAAFLAVTFHANQQPDATTMLIGFGAALAGFLLYNHNPASIFMGDCGSLFVGFFLAATALMSKEGGGGRSRSLVSVLAVPVLVLLVPIFDTTFVTLMRKLAGRAASQGGRDHTSHRLVALGLSEKRAVWMLYALAITSGALSVVTRRATLDVSILLIASLVVCLTFLGIHLGRVRVYDAAEMATARERPFVALLFDLSYKRRLFEVVLDVVLIGTSYYAAYALKFGSFRAESPDWRLFLATLPIVVSMKIAVFLAAGVYRGIWRYTGLADAVALGRAVAVASLAAVAVIVVAFRFEGFSRAALAVDSLLLLLLVVGSRLSFRLLRSLLPVPHENDARRVLIYGAGDGGELLLRELHNNSTLKSIAVAFVDDDPVKRGRLIHGVRVYSPAEPLLALCRRLGVEEVLISTNQIPHDRLSRIAAECASGGIPVTRASITFERLTPGALGWVMPPRELAPGFPVVTRDGDANLVTARGRGVSQDH